jgi:glycosyltransferase involved in cell wall biosynthesis
MTQRILLFDWVSGGHHVGYLRRIAEVLAGRFEVVLAVPDEVVAEVSDLPGRVISLGPPRPAQVGRTTAGWAFQGVLGREVRAMAAAAELARTDHIIHTYADAVLPRLTRSPRLRVPLTIVLFTPRAHYPAAFGTHLTQMEHLRANVKEIALRAWRRRSDAHAVLTLDEEAARRWGSQSGAPAYWLPEPPVPIFDPDDFKPHIPRRGCILYGALGERKGIDLLVRAVTLAPNSLEITLAGEAAASFLLKLDAYATAMRTSGASVDVRQYRHTELEGLRALATARCAVLPYPRHDGMSRVLLEAASVGTPVIAHDRGLLGHLVRRHELGVAVDCTDPLALRTAILKLTDAESIPARFADSLARFSARFVRERFAQACLAPFSIEGPAGQRSDCGQGLPIGTTRPTGSTPSSREGISIEGAEHGEAGVSG